MGRKWTAAQLDAINAKGGAVLVSAAAGSGKTAVLVERVLSRITDPESPVDIDRLLIVTYTKAAAAEMRERISASLERLSRANPDNTSYRRQLMLLPRANISTIHSFCGNVIKENFFKLDDIPSDYKIADESALSIIKSQAVDNVLERMYASGDEGFLYMSDCFSTAKSEYNLKSTVLNIYDFLCSQPFPKQWLKKAEEEYSDKPVTSSLCGKTILEQATVAAEYLSSKVKECIELYEQNPDIGVKIDETINNNYKRIVDEFSALAADGDWDGLYEFFNKKHDFGRLSAAKGYANDPAKLTIASICSMIKDELTKELPKLFIYSAEDYSRTTKIAAPAITALFKTVMEFSDEYSDLKSNNNLADFSDLERWTLRLLYNNDSPTELAAELSERFIEVMVDEYQDANEVQDLIFTAVSDGGRKLFVVGDVKQSVYRFRQANPELFLRRKNSYPLYDRNKDTYPAKIILDKNFRSRSGIAETVNFIFSKLMSPLAGDMYYTEEDMLNCGSSYEPSNEPDSTLELIFTPIKSEIPAHIAEARRIAQQIIELKSSFTVEENGVKRPAKFGDFAILLRTNLHALDYQNVLKESGIPARCAAADNFLAASEIQLVISLLKVISNPYQDIPLLNVMTSPIFAFTQTELAQLRVNTRKKSLYDSVKLGAEGGDSHCRELVSELDYYRGLSSSVTLPELISEIYLKTSYPEIVSASDAGSLKVNNLRLFYRYTMDYSDSTLSSYLRYLDSLIENDIELKGSNIDEDSGRVQIMTIHTSKGLEFPVCFVAGISSYKKTESDQLLMHPKLGVGAAINFISDSYKLESVQKQAIRMKKDIDEISEELRVLYVALTRAKERLYVLATLRSSNPEKTLSEISSRLGRDEIHPYVVRSLSTTARRLAACAILYGKNSCITNLLGQPCGVFDGKPEDFWKTEILLGADIPKPDPIETQSGNQGFKITYDEIMRRVNLSYQNSGLSSVPVKVSVSELAHKDEGREFSFAARPAFMSEQGLTAAEKGSAIHALMQFADYKAFLNDPSAEIERLRLSRYLTEAQCAAVDTDKILNCLSNPLMMEYMNAQQSFREYRFAVKIKASDVYDDLPEGSDGELLLQGAVDCAFVKDGSIIILDYKTDRVKTMQQLKERYQAQLELYSHAMKQMTGLEVSRRVIYSFELNDIIDV